MSQKEVIALEKFYIDEVIQRSENLRNLKEQMMKVPMDKSMTRMDFFALTNTIDKLIFCIQEMQNQLEDLEISEAEKILKDA